MEPVFINNDQMPRVHVIHFGATGYEDYTMHKDIKRRNAYDSRHSNEDWNDLTKAGAWAKWLLWNKSTLDASIKDMENKFDITIIQL